MKKESNNPKVAAVWKEDADLGIAYFCSRCYRFVCSNGKCDCGAYVDLNLPMEHYTGRVNWRNYTKRSDNYE